MRDKDLLDKIEDFLTNNFGADDDPDLIEALGMLDHICELLEARERGQ